MTDAHQAPPVVNNGIMFVSTPQNHVIAIDAKTGDTLWRYERELPEEMQQLHPTNRGVALYDDKVYMATMDACVVALQASTGEVVWDKCVIDWIEGYYMTLAPQVAKGKVMVGVSGGELGIRGFVAALDAETGEEAWKTYTVPGPGRARERDLEGRRLEDRRCARSGCRATTIRRPGSPISAPAMAARGCPTPGPATISTPPPTIALDVETGAIKGHHQYHWNDAWDWDEVSAPLLLDVERDGRTVPALAHAGRNGYLWTLERHARGPDQVRGRPALRPPGRVQVARSRDRPAGLQRETRSPAPTSRSPSARPCGAERTGRRRPTTRRPSCSISRPTRISAPRSAACRSDEHEPGELYIGVPIEDIFSSMRPRDGVDVSKPMKIGELQAWDLSTGKKVWSHDFEDSALWGPILTTAGNLVFAGGTNDRMFRAFDAKTGEVKWQTRLSSAALGVPTSFMVDGVQYIAVQTGYGVDAERQNNGLQTMLAPRLDRQDVPTDGTVWVFALRDKVAPTTEKERAMATLMPHGALPPSGSLMAPWRSAACSRAGGAERRARRLADDRGPARQHACAAALEERDLAAFEELVNWDGAGKMKRRVVSYQLRYGFGRPIRSIALEPFPADGFSEIEAARPIQGQHAGLAAVPGRLRRARQPLRPAADRAVPGRPRRARPTGSPWWCRPRGREATTARRREPARVGRGCSRGSASMKELLTIGQMLTVHARVLGEASGARDLERAMTFRQWNERSCRLANALLGLGLAKGDRVAILAYNCVEWLEIYAATAKAGLIAVPINFRLTGAGGALHRRERGGRGAHRPGRARSASSRRSARDLPVPSGNLIHFGQAPCPAGYRAYEELIAAASDREPEQQVAPADPWTLMYTSGTTGKPKGVLRSHQAAVLLSLFTEIELGLHRRDGALLVMPMCHANSLNFFGAFAYCGAETAVYSRKSFDPEHGARTLAEGGSTFTSLVPTHYIMMLGLPAAVRAQSRLQPRDQADDLLGPGAPGHQARVMEMFPNSGLFELYGSSEAGWVTMLHPHEQFTKLGSVGRECVGSAPIKILDESGNEVPDGESGELYSSNPYTFDGYWKLPEKTAEAFRGDYCTVGDMARRDADGYIHLVDRKSNMIISGGENIYPSEVEAVLGGHPAVKDVAVVGLPDREMGRVRPRRRRPQGRRRRERGRAARLVQGQARRLQAAARLLVHARRGDAAHRHRQESASGPQDTTDGRKGRLNDEQRSERHDRPQRRPQRLRRLDRALPPGARHRPRVRAPGRPHPADLGPHRPARHPHRRRARRGCRRAHGACPCRAHRPAGRGHGDRRARRHQHGDRDRQRHAGARARCC